MLYLNEKDIENCEISWEENVDTIQFSTSKIKKNDYSQPIKPYIEFDDPKNRIIAMPARIGSGLEGIAGLKWIASFPDNFKKNISRANSLTILNDIQTGEILSVINTSKISAIRTASVTGYIMRDYIQKTKPVNLLGLIIGYGPIGQHHLMLIDSMFQEQFDEIFIFDKQDIDKTLIPDGLKTKVRFIQNLDNYFSKADVVITCTTSQKGYLTEKPKNGSLHLNISLRDYHYTTQKFFDLIIVDSWNEVCRANTDIEIMSKINGLTKKNIIEITDIASQDYKGKTVFFNPMGMASFDVKIGETYYRYADKYSLGTRLV